MAMVFLDSELEEVEMPIFLAPLGLEETMKRSGDEGGVRGGDD
jgi:hypothetical protein